MTAPTVNGTRYPQPVDALLPAARALDLPEGQPLPSRNRLMREFRIGAPKADDLLARLKAEHEQRTRTEQTRTAMIARGALLPLDADLTDLALTDLAEPAPVSLDYAEPIGPAPAPEQAETTDRYETLRAAMIARGALLPPAGTSWTDPVTPGFAPVAEPDPTPAPAAPAAEPAEQVTTVGHPDTPTPTKPAKSAVVWPVVLLALPAFVAIWSGWVGLGGLTGFGVVHPLPGIWDTFSINSAITLPIGVETYGAYALYVWLSGRVPAPARRFAKWSALGSLAVGALGQVAYHLLEAAGVTSAPWWITTAVACLPVAVLGMGAALAHLVRTHD